MVEHPRKNIEQIIREDGRYPPEAYAFLNEGLARAVKEVHGESSAPPGQRHVTGQQICKALRELAVERWGMLARTVLAKWNIRETIDFGSMVYLLIEHGPMRKTDQDSIEDFRNVYTFDEAFKAPDKFELKE
ncbi:MAG TPA: hypothetical protein DCX07_12785 [Phycisphaerales bacterium]|nr:hypothetical protein [Phycisphaerales bacterium]